MAEVEIRLLGGFVAIVDGEAVSDRAWRLRKGRDLVKVLALARDGRLHREQVMDVLWGDRDPTAAANNFYQAVHAARRALGREAIGLRQELLSLAAQVDVTRFERAAVEARRAGSARAYRAAVALYTGELLPENRYDDWASGRRVGLEELHVSLLAELESLGAVGGLRGLPADASSFVGREHELSALGALLGRTRLLTLTGTGGVGKTRLAFELARGAEPSFVDGVVLAELAAVADSEGVVDAVATALDVRALAGRTPADAVAEFLAARNLMLVIDNCEHVLGASAWLVDALLRAAPRLTVVATSREPLRAAGETVFHVPPLAIPVSDRESDCADFLRYESVRLFVARADAAARGFALDETNAADIARICSRLDGLPLALELAAARIGALSPATIVERLDDRFALLRAGRHAVPRQQTLEATLLWSHELLGPLERLLLRRTAVFTGGFDLAAVEVVCADERLAVREVADLLGRLVEKSLVAVESLGEPRRYRLLESVRLFAHGQLERSGEATVFDDRHAAWALDLATRQRESVSLDRDAANLAAALERVTVSAPNDALRLCVALGPFWLRRMELREANRSLQEALAAAPEPTSARAEALLTAAGLNLRGGEPARGLAFAEESLEVAMATGATSATWRALQTVGEYELTYGKASLALGWLEQGLELARRRGLAAEEAHGVYSLGVAHWLARLPDAEGLIAQSVDLFTPLERSRLRIPAPINVAETRTSHDEGRAGIRVVLEETLQPFVEVSCAQALAYVLANQAVLMRSFGDLTTARALLDESWTRFAGLKDERGQAHVLARRGFVELAVGALDEARDCLTRSLEMRRELNDRRGIGLALSGLACVETGAADYRRARAHLAEAQDLFLRTGDRWGLVNALWRSADVGFAADDIDAAESALGEALDVLRETRLERWIAHTVTGLAEVALLRNDTRGASELLADAGERYAAAGDPSGVAAVRARVAALAEKLQS